MNCPHCNVALVLSERRNIEIDYCPTCRGVWLDRGELDKLIDTSAPEYPRDRGRDRDYDRDDDRYERDRPYRHKKKSILSEIFDF